MKILSFNKGIGINGEVCIHVMGASNFADELKKRIGKNIGNATLVAVTEGDILPDQAPSVIYVGDPLMLDSAIRHTRENHIISITGLPGLVPKGVTLGIGVEKNKPKVLLNTTASEYEKIKWNPAIYTIAITFK